MASLLRGRAVLFVFFALSGFPSEIPGRNGLGLAQLYIWDILASRLKIQASYFRVRVKTRARDEV